MTKTKTLEELQVEHARLCALAADNGVALSDALTVDFDTVEEGQIAVESIAKLLGETSDAGVAKDVEVEQGTSAAPKKKKIKAAKVEKPKPVADATQQETETMATTKKVKKTAAKKAAPKKGVAKKAAPKKAGAKKGVAKKKAGPRADSMTSKIVAKMKGGGITRAEVLKMTGWKAVSMQQLAASAGVALKVSESRPFTYSAK